MSNQPIKNQEYTFPISLVSQSTGQFQANPTLAAGDVKVVLDDDAPANIGTLPVVDADFTRRVKVTLSATEMNHDKVCVYFIDAAGSEWDEAYAFIEPVSWLDTNDDITGLAANVITATSINNDAITAAKIADGAIDAATFAAGAINAAAIAADAIGASELAADAVVEIQSGLSTLTAAQVNTEVDTALADINLDHLMKIAVDTNFATTVHLDSVVGHLADNGTTATFDRTTDSLEALQAEHDATQSAVNTVDDFLDTEIAAIKAKTDNLPSDPADESSIQAAIAAVQADTDNIQTRLPAALSGDGFMKADLKSIEDELTDGNNATLKLKSIDIRNTTDHGVLIQSSADDKCAMLLRTTGTGGVPFYAASLGAGGGGVQIEAPLNALNIVSTVSGAGIYTFGTDGRAGIESYSDTGKSINASQNIAVSDGNLTLAAIASAVLASVIETGYTLKQSMRLMLSALAGKLSGAATTTVVIRSAPDAKDRITATVDSDGNRTAVTHDVSD